jgi:hypothetical protein
MAFKPTAVPASTTDSSTNDNWKAQGFINVYLPTKDGSGRRKLGAFALKDSNVNEKALREFVEADETNLAKVAAKLIVEYQSATPAEGSGFDLS